MPSLKEEILYTHRYVQLHSLYIDLYELPTYLYVQITLKQLLKTFQFQLFFRPKVKSPMVIQEARQGKARHLKHRCWIKTECEPAKIQHIHQTPPLLTSIIPKQERSSLLAELEWDPNLEYDPLHPTDYDKIIRERKERRGMEIEIEEAEKKRKSRDDRDVKTRERPPVTGSGFSRLHVDEEEEEEPIVKKSSTSGGVAIAPPPSLQEISPSNSSLAHSGTGAGALGVAAKIMAKYGFKEGQGLGRQQQGIAAALQVEKTSKRGGRIINEKEIMPPPPPVLSPSTSTPKAELSIAEIMKNPSKVIWLKNMVGPGEVDSDLEPEVREECQTKYGDVNKVVIFEVPNTEEEEAVRIFVEFKRMEAAIKAVIDLNGRFFAGRQVKAGFFDVEKFGRMELND
uniref:Splicing factor 45 n=1 Tax=Simocephalus serrulatus TaxID=117539 RepID=A0A4Y7NMG4_9CRUS|nr:EOG090X0BIL [Simocephalus serrulatus]SVE94441.1 EOG090X0BIL [Simocephalus serrulatus]